MRLHRFVPIALLPALLAVPAGAGSPAATASPAAAVAVLAGISASGLDVLLDPAHEPGQEMLAQRGGTIPTGAFARASIQAQQLAVRTAAAEPATAAARWSLRGPTNVGGRVLDVVVDPLAEDALYAATASGGVWHSTDAAKTWTSVWPDELTQAVGALAISKTGVLWAGTGEAGPGGGSITYGGTGVYRSADGGRTWTNMGLRGSERIGRVVVDTQDEDTIWVAAGGPLYTRGGERGLFRSTDAGRTWTKMLAGTNDTTGAVDVALDPSDPSTVYTTFWDRLREPDRRLYTGTGSGAFKSTDAGRTWARIGGPALASSPVLGRIGITVAPNDPSRVYLLSSTEAGLTAGLYRSSDSGATFTPGFDVPLITGGFVYAWWFGRVYVDPKDADHLFATGVNMSESTDGGASYASSPGLHADQHAMAWDLRIPDRVYVGNDGGMYRSDDNGASFEHGEYMPWNQPFSVAVSQQHPDRLLAGLQDNGGNRNYDAEAGPGPDRYNDITGGDGTEMAIDPSDDAIVYGCSQYGACARSTDAGENMSSFDNEIVGSRKNWLTPIEFDPQDGAVAVTASEIVHLSTDHGASWRPISPDLTGGPGRETNPLFRSYGTVTTLAVALAEADTIYAGTDDGRVQYTHDGGLTWTRATGLPTDWVSAVTIDHRDPARVAYATFSGFRSGSSKALVFRTGDGGVSWTDVTGDLPQAPVNDVLSVGDDLVVATDVGVFLTRRVTTGKGGSWLKVGAGLPNAPITEVAWQAATRTLVVGNFGRGVYSLPMAGLGTTAALPAVAPAPAAPATAAGATSPGTASPASPAARLPATGLQVPLALAALVLLAGTVGLRRSRS